MTRIKYYERGEELVTDWYTIGPNLVIRGVIDTKSFTYSIIEFNSSILISGSTDNLRSAKSSLKNNLKLSGVQFFDEIRQNYP